MFKLLGLVIIFAFVFMLVTFNLSEQLGQESTIQLGFGLVIGALLWIGMRATEK